MIKGGERGGGDLLVPPPLFVSSPPSRKGATVARLCASKVKEGDSETAPKEKSRFEDRPRMRRKGRNLPDVSWVRGVTGSMHPLIPTSPSSPRI